MRALLAIVVLVLALAASGCLRTKFDLCAQDPPDPQCGYLDAGTDAPGADDAASNDAPGADDAASEDATPD